MLEKYISEGQGRSSDSPLSTMPSSQISSFTGQTQTNNTVAIDSVLRP